MQSGETISTERSNEDQYPPIFSFHPTNIYLSNLISPHSLHSSHTGPSLLLLKCPKNAIVSKPLQMSLRWESAQKVLLTGVINSITSFSSLFKSYLLERPSLITPSKIAHHFFSFYTPLPCFTIFMTVTLFYWMCICIFIANFTH